MYLSSRRQARKSFVNAHSHSRPHHFIPCEATLHYDKTAPHHARGMLKLEINCRWGLKAVRIWARWGLIVFTSWYWGSTTKRSLEQRAARQRQFYYSRYVRNGNGNGHHPHGRRGARVSRESKVLDRAHLEGSSTPPHCSGLIPFLLHFRTFIYIHICI
jgi:hypothetical protein